MILQELGVPYTYHSFAFDNVKDKAFTDINPNGRVPGEFYLPNTNVFGGRELMQL
jgi:glutathione S-transferase